MKSNFTLIKRYQFVYLQFFISALFSSVNVFAQPTSQTFNTSGTYTVPIGYSAIVTIEAWGGGGGGGTNLGNAKGGGGGAAYASVTTTLTPGNYTVTVGAGGTPGNAGGNSSFTTLVLAAGGSSTADENGGAGGTIAASIGTILFAGGNGGNGGSSTGIRGGGGGGGSATQTLNGGNGGNGLIAPLGTGGIGGNGAGIGGRGADNNATPDASPGVMPGSGGGGKGRNGNSQSGANGQVVVTVISVLPVQFGSIQAFERQSGIQIDWNVYWEENVSHYEIESSVNGRDFIKIGTVTSRNNRTASNYSWSDQRPIQGVSYYRIKSIDIDQKFMYSPIVKINLNKTIKDISVYPNPVTGGQISIQSSNLEKGNYIARVLNFGGQQVYKSYFEHSGGAITKMFQLHPNLGVGMFTLQIDRAGVIIKNKSFIIQ